VVESPKPAPVRVSFGLSTPESVLYDEESDRYFVSNINGTADGLCHSHAGIDAPVFWALSMVASGLTTLLSMSPFEVNRCPLPASDRPDGCPKQGAC
jgi:hypothetical protein